MVQPGTIEVPVQMVQSVGDAVILGVAADALRQVVPSATATMPGH
jgi:sporulation protein YlmC with PRC-barrel domain